MAGLSMGGSLAIWLAERHPEIAGVIVVNPLVDPPASSFRDMFSGMIEEGGVSVPAIGSDIAMSRPSSRPTTPRRSSRCSRCSKASTRSPPGSAMLAARCCCFRAGPTTSCRPSRATCSQLRQAGPSSAIWLERSYHVATLDYDAAEIEERAVAFVHKLGESK